MNLSHLYISDDYSGLKDIIAGERSVFLIHDINVSEAAESLGINNKLALDISEADKTIDTAMDICRFLLETGADRGSLVLAMGGGVTTDTVGFAACIYKRGVRFATLPTTLLGQVDAGIGGKTGVNLDGYKNILGCIRQPEWIYAAHSVLDTLPEREYRCGVAELLKTFLIADAGAYAQAVRTLKDTGKVTAEMVRNAAGIKLDIVRQDPFEDGLRRRLNLGHTIGHAIEWWQTGQKERLTHGEAVAIGIVQAARLSEAAGACAKGLAARLEKDFQDIGLPVECPVECPVEPSVLADAIAKDKKAEGDGIHFVLLKDIGSVEVRLMGISDIINLLETTSL